MVPPPTRTRLEEIVGEAHVRPAEVGDAIDGVRAGLVVQPASAEEVSRVLSFASEAGLRVAPRGGGTAMGLGNPPEGIDLIVDLRRLNRLIEHASGDLVVAVEAGIELRTLQETLAGKGQMLAIDGAAPGATIGGIIAANTSGPRRLRYGTVRDLLIGVTIALPDGTLAKAGGKVVKNVAGYDLAKLLTGSLGTLGIVVQAIFRLHPQPPAGALIEMEFGSAGEVAAAVQRLLHSVLVPTAIQLHWPSGERPLIAVLVEGVEPSVISQAALAAELLGPAATTVREVAEVGERWRELVGPRSVGRSGDDVELKVTCLPFDLGTTLDALHDRTARHGLVADIVGSLGNGVLTVRLAGASGQPAARGAGERPERAAISPDPAEGPDSGPAAAAGQGLLTGTDAAVTDSPAPEVTGSDAGSAATVVHDLRSAIQPGHVVVTAAPAWLKRQVDVWGPMGNSIDLMRRVKERFDPDRMLNPGRFVGGI